MPRNFYFGPDSDIVAGATNFAAKISSSPETYSLSVEQCEAFSELAATLKASYLAANNPGTRTSVAVSSKNLAIAKMRAMAIFYARIIYANENINDAQLSALGLQPRPTRQARAVPSSAPSVSIIAVIGRVVKLRVRDVESTSRGIPFGAIGCNLYWCVSEEAPTDPNAYRFETMTTRAITDIVFPNDVPSGATVWISAQWVNKRGERSIGGMPTSFTLQGGPVVAAA